MKVERLTIKGERSTDNSQQTTGNGTIKVERLRADCSEKPEVCSDVLKGMMF